MGLSDNLPPDPQKVVEDEIEVMINKLSRRYQLTMLKQLYVLLKTPIADLNREIAKAERAEIAEKAT